MKIYLKEKIGNQELFTGRKKDISKSLMENLPADFKFANYKTVWSYTGSPVYQRDFQFDVLARAKSDRDYSLIGEVKNRKSKFSIKEAAEFIEKAVELKELEGVEKAVLFVFSSGGFYKNSLQHLEKHGVAWTEDPRWLEP